MAQRRELPRTVADVRPNHIEYPDDQNAKLNYKRIQIRRNIPVDKIQHVRSMAQMILHIDVILVDFGDRNRSGRFRYDRIDPHGQRCANRVHQEHSGHAAILVDNHVHILENEEEHEYRVYRENDVHRQGGVRCAQRQVLVGEEDHLVGDLQDGVDEETQSEP